MRTILAERRRMATILGYKDYSDYILEQRMAKNGETATTFVADIAAKYRPAATAEFAELLGFARELEKNPQLELEAGDTGGGSYYSKKLKAREVGIDEEALKDYFELEGVLAEMFTALNTLYGVTLKTVDHPGWHPDVQAYEVHDGDKHLATVWCDWYARKGKRGGAWFNRFYTGDQTDANLNQPHLGCVITNFDEPNTDGKSRLTPRDVETIWHEFGHFMHFALGTMELAEQSMFATRWDFVEAPSQIMENWVWQPEVLKRMAKHDKTGETLSDEILEKLLAARRFQAGLNAMGQSYLAMMDLKLHRDYDVDGTVGVEDYSRGVKRDFVFTPVKDDDAMVATFLHLFAGGYGSGYYSYKWAEVIEADFFAHFMKEGYLNPKVGNDYRVKVLAPGSSIEPDVLVRDFLGRDATVDALLERDGIDKV
jgi:oligopeptidase A